MGILDAPGVSPKQLVPVAADAWRALSLGSKLSSRQPAVSTAPTITWNTSAPAATPTYKTAYDYGTNLTNPAYTLSGGVYIKAGNSAPDRDACFSDIIPGNGAVGSGSADVDFYSDAPSITFPYYRTQNGTLRVLVDDVEWLRVGNSLRFATAQAGAASTITFDAGASAVNGFYATRFVAITGGTGAGQTRQIISYVGSTKVATVGVAWTTVPDATSLFSISQTRQTFHNAYNTGSTLAYLNLDWSGERRMRRYRVETGATDFFGCYIAVTDQLVAAPKPTGPRCIWLGDSFSEGTGTEAKEGMAWIACRQLGWEMWNMSVGGTGYLNPDPSVSPNGSMPFGLRFFPPRNAWRWNRKGATGANVTVTQGAISATFAVGATALVIQSAMDTAFGAGMWNVYGGSPSAYTNGVWFIGTGSNASNTAALTADSTYVGANGGINQIAQWLGDLAPCVPVDGAGNALPFVVVLAGGHNDTTGTSAAYTPTVLQAAVSDLITRIQTAYPTAVVIVLGVMYLPGAAATSTGGAWDSAVLAAVTASARKINGQVPFLPLLNLFTGSGYLGNLQANGSSDFATHTDGVHPAPIGHFVYGTKIASQINALLGRS